MFRFPVHEASLSSPTLLLCAPPRLALAGVTVQSLGAGGSGAVEAGPIADGEETGAGPLQQLHGLLLVFFSSEEANDRASEVFSHCCTVRCNSTPCCLCVVNAPDLAGWPIPR